MLGLQESWYDTPWPYDYILTFELEASGRMLFQFQYTAIKAYLILQEPRGRHDDNIWDMDADIPDWLVPGQHVSL